MWTERIWVLAIVASLIFSISIGFWDAVVGLVCLVSMLCTTVGALFWVRS